GVDRGAAVALDEEMADAVAREQQRNGEPDQAAARHQHGNFLLGHRLLLSRTAAASCKRRTLILPGKAVTVTLYGIRNCDTMKKARAWLDANGIAYRFHDYRAEGIDAARLAHWSEVLGWERLLNRAGTTFRGLSEADKAGLDAGKAEALM